MTTSPPTLYWYQLTSGTLASAYWGQLDTCVRSLCTENSISLPTAPWYSTIAGTLNSAWIIQIDAKVRALCTALSVTAPTALNLIPGTETANYYASLDGAVRALCAVPSYTGPLDLVPGATVAYSAARALSVAMLGSIVAIVGGANAVADATTGNVNGGSVSGTVSSFKDQSGNAEHVTQATGALRPAWAAAVFGTAPALDFDGTTILTTSGDVSLPNGAFTVFAVTKGVDASVPRYLLGENYDVEDAPDTEIAFAIAVGPKIYVDAYDLDETNEAGGRSNNFTDATAAHICEAAWEFGSRAFLVDGAVLGTSSSFDSGGPLGPIGRALAIGYADAAVTSNPDFFKGQCAEILVYPTLLSSGDRTLIRQNMATYYGITLS